MKELFRRLFSKPGLATELVAASLFANILALAAPLFVILFSDVPFPARPASRGRHLLHRSLHRLLSRLVLFFFGLLLLPAPPFLLPLVAVFAAVSSTPLTLPTTRLV